MDRNFSVQSFIAYDGGRITHLKQLKQKNILITVGVSEPSIFFYTTTCSVRVVCDYFPKAN